MARTVRDARLESRTARGELRPRNTPYFRSIHPGLHLGYRKGKKGGAWFARWYDGERYRTEKLGTADDTTDADGATILSYKQAMNAAREWEANKKAEVKGIRTGPYTVEAAWEDYEREHLRPHGRGSGPIETRRLVKREVLPTLGDQKVTDLTSKQLREWLDGIAARPPQKRGGKAHEVDMSDPEVQRRRRDTANRALRTLKAILNHAYNEGRVPTDGEWRRVKAFKATTGKRPRYLTTEEVSRLLNAAQGNFRNLVRGALVTGARPGDLKRLTVEDFDPDNGSVAVANRKAGKPYVCHLSDEGVTFFQQLTKGRLGTELIFHRDDGSPWGDDDHQRPMREANKAAKLDPPADFYTLRHTYCSHAIMNGVPMLVVAHNVGHSDTRMIEAHYGHLADSYSKRVLRENLPRWSEDDTDNVTPITARGKG